MTKSNPIFALRESLNMTQAELAAKLDCTPGRISQLECGSAPAGARLLTRIFRVYRRQLASLGISPMDVLNATRSSS